jgi:hypothetical protein
MMKKEQKKERPSEINKRMTRLKESRDGLKENNRNKTLLNQKLRDRNVEIEDCRDRWKKQSKVLKVLQGELEEKLLSAQREAELERMRADTERDRADKLQIEVENIRKKKSWA